MSRLVGGGARVSRLVGGGRECLGLWGGGGGAESVSACGGGGPRVSRLVVFLGFHHVHAPRVIHVGWHSNQRIVKHFRI